MPGYLGPSRMLRSSPWHLLAFRKLILVFLKTGAMFRCIFRILFGVSACITFSYLGYMFTLCLMRCQTCLWQVEFPTKRFISC